MIIGWPSRGPTRDAAVASVANEAKFLRKFLALAEEEKYTYYLMEAFDQVWKTGVEGAAGDAWGVRLRHDRAFAHPRHPGDGAESPEVHADPP